MADPAICETSPKYSLLVVLFYHAPMAVPAESSPNFCTMCLISKNRSCIVKVITSTRHGAKPPTVIGAPPQKLPTHGSCVNQLLPNSSSNYRQMVPHCCAPGFALQEASLQCVRPHPANVPIPENDQKLSTPHRGYAASAGHPNQTITVGIHTNPTEFVL